MDRASTKEPTGLPVYVAGKNLGSKNAIFDDGSVVAVQHGRRRAYPSLLSEAPPTAAFYTALKAAAPAALRVLDLGCGSGIGTRLLTRDFPTVIGVDCDPAALEFAREYAPVAAFSKSDLSHPPKLDPVDAAIVCDLLGHVDDPATALRSLHAVLSAGGTVLIAEPRAYPAQHLRAPVRRAFSEQSLASLLGQSGFVVKTWLSQESSFLACIAVATNDGSAQLFAKAKADLHAGNSHGAIASYQRLIDTASPAVRGEALILLANLHLSKLDGEPAIACLLRAGEILNADSRVYAGLSRIALLTGSLQDALRLAVAASEADPTSPTALRCLAESSAALGEHADSFSALRIAAALAPADREIATELARAAAERENFKYGINALERLRGYYSEMGADFHVTLGWLLTLAGRRADALLEARHALLIAPGDERALELASTLR